MIKTHFASLYAKRYLALSMELVEFSEGGSYKHNNVHAKFKKATA
jgi:5-carboxymethyl-2-hydroxymuconate isomerase